MAHVYVLDGVNLSLKARVAAQSYVTPLLLMQLLHWSACCIMQVGKQSQNFLLSKRTFVALHHGKLLASLSLLRSIPSYFTIQNVDRSREEEYNISRIHAPILTLFHPLPICLCQFTDTGASLEAAWLQSVWPWDAWGDSPAAQNIMSSFRTAIKHAAFLECKQARRIGPIDFYLLSSWCKNIDPPFDMQVYFELITTF